MFCLREEEKRKEDSIFTDGKHNLFLTEQEVFEVLQSRAVDFFIF